MSLSYSQAAPLIAKGLFPSRHRLFTMVDNSGWSLRPFAERVPDIMAAWVPIGQYLRVCRIAGGASH